MVGGSVVGGVEVVGAWVVVVESSAATGAIAPKEAIANAAMPTMSRRGNFATA